jgi:hypothetical protein
MAGVWPAPGSAVRHDLSLAEVLLSFWKHAEKKYSVEGRELAMFKLSLKPLNRLYGQTKASDFGPKALKAVQTAMASGCWMNDEERNQAKKRSWPTGWCRNVVNCRVVRIKTFFKWAESEELVPKGTYHALATVSGLPLNEQTVRHTKPVEPATETQLNKILPHFHRP